MRKKLLAGNWKMHKTNSELSGFFSDFLGGVGEVAQSTSSQVEIMFAVPYTLLNQARELTKSTTIQIASQNVHWEAQGAFTGEVSIAMLKDIDISTTLIGHSERRQYYSETDETVAKKTVACLEQGITPVVCIGETLEERESGKTEEVVKRQVTAVFESVNDPKDMILAYEPVWAIGTGKSATADQAQEVHGFIRKLVEDKYGSDKSQAMRILYGGSAKPANISELLSQKDIDGGLVGGASLKPADFAQMVKAGA